MTEPDQPDGGWIVEVELAREPGQQLVGDGDLRRLLDVLKEYQPVLYAEPSKYTVEMFVGRRPSDGLRDLASQLVNGALRQAQLPLWPIVDVRVREAEVGSCEGSSDDC